MYHYLEIFYFCFTVFLCLILSPNFFFFKIKVTENNLFQETMIIYKSHKMLSFNGKITFTIFLNMIVLVYL